MDLNSIGPVLWVVIDGLGFVLAVVVIIAWPRLRSAAALVAISLLVSLGIHGAWPLALSHGHGQVERGLWSNEEMRAFVSTWSFAANVVGVLAKGLLVAAAFAWRSGDSPDLAAATSGARVPGAPMPALSTSARVGGILASFVLGTGCAGAAILLAEQRDPHAALILLAASAVLTVVGIVLVATTLHALWQTIQPPPRGRGCEALARTTPGAAVGLLFVPLFNFYWAFHALPGLATDMNRALDAMAIAGPRVPRGLGIAWCVAGILACIPVVGPFVGLAGLVILPLFFGAAIGAANRIRTAAADER